MNDNTIFAFMCAREYLTFLYFKILFFFPFSDVTLRCGHERDGEIWRADVEIENSLENVFIYQRNSFVCWNFVLSPANTQPHTIIINSHSYFFPPFLSVLSV